MNTNDSRTDDMWKIYDRDFSTFKKCADKTYQKLVYKTRKELLDTEPLCYCTSKDQAEIAMEFFKLRIDVFLVEPGKTLINYDPNSFKLKTEDKK